MVDLAGITLFYVYVCGNRRPAVLRGLANTSSGEVIYTSLLSRAENVFKPPE